MCDYEDNFVKVSERIRKDERLDHSRYNLGCMWDLESIENL